MNGAAETIQDLNDLPIQTVNNSTTYIKDVANVRDGNPPQTNIVRVNGSRAALMVVLKNGNVSTLDVISGVKAALPAIAAGLPPEFKNGSHSFGSILVRQSIDCRDVCSRRARLRLD